MLNKYTVFYSLTMVHPHPEWADVVHYHLAWVSAQHSILAIERCQQDALPGWTFKMLLVFEDFVPFVSKAASVLKHVFEPLTDAEK